MHILFATPSYRGITYAPFLDSLEQTIALCTERGHTTEFYMVTGCCYVQTARNQIVKHFLDSGADVLFFLDDDISWPATAALKVIETPGEVVAGIYPLKTEPLRFPVVIHTTPNDCPVQRADGCVAAAAVPTGFLCIHRSALERMVAAYPGQRYVCDENGEMYDLFPQGVSGGRWVGEDYAFCRLWREIGGEMWVVCNISFTHGSQSGNFHDYLMGGGDGMDSVPVQQTCFWLQDKRCPRCGSSLISDGKHIWCSFVGNREQKGCSYGIDGTKVPLNAEG